MTEKSKYLGSLRELMIGENQCGINIEWPLEQQPELLVGVDVIIHTLQRCRIFSTEK
jgi:hypothetical protein